MRARTNLKAGRIVNNHNETLARGLKPRTALKAGRKAGGVQQDW
jgi:hypothetical protein